MNFLVKTKLDIISWLSKEDSHATVSSQLKVLRGFKVHMLLWNSIFEESQYFQLLIVLLSFEVHLGT